MKLFDQQTVCIHIEELVQQNDITYLEAVCEFCKSKGIDIDDIPKFLNAAIKTKIEVEAVNLNFFKTKKPKKKLPLG